MSDKVHIRYSHHIHELPCLGLQRKVQLEKGLKPKKP